MRKKSNFLPDWRKIVAGMIIAATATIGGSYASAQDLWRSDVGGAPAAWNGTDLWADDVEGGTNYVADSAGYNVILGTIGAGTLTTDTAGADTADSLTVTGAGWTIDGTIAIADGLKIDTDGTLRLKAGDLSGGIYKVYSITGGTIQIDGTLEVEAGALFSNGAGAINMNGGTFSLLAGDPMLTAVNTADPIVLGADGGTFLVDDGLEVEFRGAISLDTGVTGADFTKSGDGLFVHGSRFDPATSTVDLGTGTATYDGGTTRIESQDYKAGNLVVTGATTVLDVKSDNSVPNVDISGMTTVSNGAQMTLGTGVDTVTDPGNPAMVPAVFKTGSLTIDGTDSTFTVGYGSSVDVTATAADAVLVQGGGNLTIDTGADLSAFASKTFNATLNDGTVAVVNSTGTASNDAYSNANITVGADGGTLDVGGADLTLTLTADSKILGTQGGDFTKTGLGKLVIDSGEVGIDGKAVFMDGDVTIDTGNFKSVGITANSALILAAAADVDAGYDATTPNVDGIVTINKSLDMSAGNNALKGHDLTFNGTFSDTTDSVVAMTGTTTFNALTMTGPTQTTINGDFSTENLVLGEGITSAGVQVTVADTSTYGGGTSYTGGNYSVLDASAAPNSLSYTDKVSLGVGATVKAQGLTVGGEFSDAASSEIDLQYVTNPGDPTPEYANGDLKFMTADATGNVVVNGQLTNVKDVTGEDAAGNRIGLDLRKGFTASGTVKAGDLILAEKQVYDADQIDITGTYTDTASTEVNVTNAFLYAQGATVIRSSNFNAGELNVLNTQQLTLESGAQVNVGSDSRIDGELYLKNKSLFAAQGKDILNAGTIVVEGGENSKATIDGAFDNQGVVQFMVDSAGKIGSLDVNGKADGSGANNVFISSATDANKNLLGANLQGGKKHDLIFADEDSEDAAFVLDELKSNTNSWKFELESDLIETGTPGNTVTKKVWQLGAYNEAVVPDVSSFFLASIMGFDLPRAQNVSGPWVRMKGGHIDDDRAQLDKMTFQMLQIGWDKSFDAVNGNGNWFAGIFMEGNWMYGKGQYHRVDYDYAVGNLKSSQRGMGAGLYVSRGFESGWYVDMIGRINVYDSEIDMDAYKFADPDKAKTSSYRGDWTDQIFSFGIEIGKTFDSKNKRFAFNPYNRVIYNSMPTNTYDLIFGDDTATPMKVRSHATDAWTNQLGARLYWNSLNKDGRNYGNIYFGGDYYQGLSGRFAVSMIDSNILAADKTADWQKSKLGRTKNDLSYGLATIGTTILPKDNIAISAQLDGIFGDVEGWAATLGFRYSY